MSAVPDITVDPRAGSARDVVEAPRPALTVEYLVELAMVAEERAGREYMALDENEPDRRERAREMLRRHFHDRLAHAVQVHLNEIDESEQKLASALDGLAWYREELAKSRDRLDDLRQRVRGLAKEIG